jgi:hypothetical protein
MGTSPVAVVALARDDDVADAHAPAETSVRASDSLSSDAVWDMGTVVKGVVTAR